MTHKHFTPIPPMWTGQAEWDVSARTHEGMRRGGRATRSVDVNSVNVGIVKGN